MRGSDAYTKHPACRDRIDFVGPVMNLLRISRNLVLATLLAVSCWTANVSAQDRIISDAPVNSFSLVVIPDTQHYLGRGTKRQPQSTDEVTNTVFDNHTKWILENLDAQRIVFVSHVGDIVDRNVPEQWQVARRAMDRLHGSVPYGISVGNHDMTKDGDSGLFQEFFPAARFASFDWYGGSFVACAERPNVSGNNANSYALFSAEGHDFVFLHLECNAPDDVLAWADGVLARHANRWALVTTHMDLGPIEHPATRQGFITDPKGRMRWTKIHGSRGNTAQQMWDKCFRKHANLRMIFCGDQSRSIALHLKTTSDHGHVVHSLLSDYTSSGPLRLYRFRPADGEVDVITYDTTRGELVDDTELVHGRENHQFTIPIDLRR